MKKYLWSLLFFCFSFLVNGQIDFEQNTNLIESESFSTLPMAIADFNGDMADDLVQIPNGKNLYFNFQNANAQTFDSKKYNNITTGWQWSCVAGDLNNDGLNEIAISGLYDGAKIYGRSSIHDDFTVQQMTNQGFFAQNSNMVDMNADGHTDLFICDDDAESEVFLNAGNGLVYPNVTFLDMETVPVSDNSGNYGSVWTDFDDDGDIDLYISKCRQGAIYDWDPRRINQLFENQGDNTFIEKASDYGLAVSAQSWAGNFGDIDNDGDLDCFIVNHEDAFNLFENIENDTFIDIAEAAGVADNAYGLQSVMRDFDNDGYLDILTAGAPAFFYRNLGDKTFEKIKISLMDEDFSGYSIGDLNSDGFLDIYTHYSTSFTMPSFQEDKLWMNTGNTNHFIAFQLRGTSSNRMGLGAKLKLYGDWGIMTREVYAGESYGISNTFTKHFGLGAHTNFDSLVIKWPSGTEQVILNKTIDQFYQISEDGCVQMVEAISIDGSSIICDGDSVLLTAPNGLEYEWSTGETSQSIYAKEAGDYLVKIVDSEGCLMTPIGVNILVEVESVIPVVNVIAGSFMNCIGDSVLLEVSEGSSFLWSNGDTTQQTWVTATDYYFVEVPGTCNIIESESIEIIFADVELPIVMHDTIYAPGVATLSAEGDQLTWYDAAIGGSPVGEGAEFETPLISESATYYVENSTLINDTIELAGELSHEGENDYASANFNGGLLFNVYEPIRLHSIEAYTDFAGIRKITIRKNGIILHEKEVYLSLTDSVMILDFDLEPDEDYLINTEIETNQTHLDSNGPKLKRTYNTFTNYPYLSDNNNLEITFGDFFQDHYYYFYNWVIKHEAITCVSERVPVEAVLETSSIENLNYSEIKVYPNPVQDILQIQLEKTTECVHFVIYTPSGKTVLYGDFKGDHADLDVSSLSSGMYILELKSAEIQILKRLVKSF